MKKIIMIIGTRPNYMKAFPIYNQLKRLYKLILIHTGQHYDYNLNTIFREELELPTFDYNLKLSSSTKAGILEDKLYINNSKYLENINNVINDLMITNDLGQIGEIRDKLIDIFYKMKPELIIVFGDVTSTLSAAIACKYLGIKLAHMESGLRSNDISMPEEVNRIIVDNLTDYFFITEMSGYENLIKEGKMENLYLVGNPMISSLIKFREKSKAKECYKKFNLEHKKYILITLHRPSNVDIENKLKEIINDIINLSSKYKIIIPLHQRTKKRLLDINIIPINKNLILCDSLGYLDFLNLQLHSMCIITDSGGIQEETSYLGIPCFTLRENTERPGTLIENGGTNTLINKITLDLDYEKQYLSKLDYDDVGENVLNILKLLI